MKIMPCRRWQNFKDESGNEPRTLVLVIGESTQRGRMSLYGYPRETTPERMRCIKPIRI